jgi:hypothetical protein
MEPTNRKQRTVERKGVKGLFFDSAYNNKVHLYFIHRAPERMFPASELGPPHPLSRKTVCPPLLRVRG